MKELGLETIYMPENGENILISSKDVNRPGVEFTGFLDFYDNKRILVVGHTENAFFRPLFPGRKGEGFGRLDFQKASGYYYLPEPQAIS